MRERLDKTDAVRDMRETYDKWMDVVDGKLLFLNQQVKEAVASMSNPETASLQDIFKVMATKVRSISFILPGLTSEAKIENSNIWLKFS